MLTIGQTEGQAGQIVAFLIAQHPGFDLDALPVIETDATQQWVAESFCTELPAKVFAHDQAIGKLVIYGAAEADPATGFATHVNVKATLPARVGRRHKRDLDVVGRLPGQNAPFRLEGIAVDALDPQIIDPQPQGLAQRFIDVEQLTIGQVEQRQGRGGFTLPRQTGEQRRSTKGHGAVFSPGQEDHRAVEIDGLHDNPPGRQRTGTQVEGGRIGCEQYVIGPGAITQHPHIGQLQARPGQQPDGSILARRHRLTQRAGQADQRLRTVHVRGQQPRGQAQCRYEHCDQCRDEDAQTKHESPFGCGARSDRYSRAKAGRKPAPFCRL